jgi:hypothetical protein
LWIGIADGVWVFFMVLWGSLSLGSDQPTTNTATREAWELGLVAAAKEKQTEQHAFRVALPFRTLSRLFPRVMEPVPPNPLTGPFNPN